MKLNVLEIAKNSTNIFYKLRWGSTIYCPRCASIHIYNKEAGKRHICADCGYRFSDTSNTIFHSSKLSLDKWLVAIYMFCNQSKGVSSYNLSRMIGVSQPSCWGMLKKLRESIKVDLKINDIGMMDEVYLGADWSKKPQREKFKHVKPLPSHLDPCLEKNWLRCEMMRAASADKIQILGISAYNNRYVSLQGYNTDITRSIVKSHITTKYDNVKEWVTDESTLYRFLDVEPQYTHHVCKHKENIYRSDEGYSSNRLEGVFSHLKRVWRGIYHHFSKKYSQSYLNEFCWRWSYFDEPVESRLNRLFEFLVAG